MEVRKKKRVLIVDDEPTICRALTMALERAGYDVRAVETGDRATDLVRSEHFDCLVVDLRIPDMRGDMLFEYAAAQQPHLRYQTLFTTGDVTEAAEDLINACRCPVLPKPFDLSDLRSWIETLTDDTRESGIGNRESGSA